MKKLFFLCALTLSLTAQAEIITMDLSTAFDLMGEPIVYNEQNIWADTYSEDFMTQFFYCNDYGVFSFLHMPSGNSWGGVSWEGFTLSKIAEDTIGNNGFACMAQGGLQGKGTPYLIGYYSEYYTFTNEEEMPSSNIITFNQDYYPTEVAICQDNNTYDALVNGNALARPFTADDTLTLIISSLNETYEIVNSIEYHLAANLVFNQGWEKIDLTPLGLCYGLCFTMTSTDVAYGFMNTPSYFALDGLQVSTEEIQESLNNSTESAPKATKRIINGTLYIEQNGTRYTATGIRTN